MHQNVTLTIAQLEHKIMKNNFYSLKFIALCISIIIMYSCKTSEKNSAKKYYLEGLYCTEKMPADIGEPYRIYLKFKKDGTVISMNSSLECDTIKKLIDNNWAETGKYIRDKNDSLNFTFTNNRVNNNEYTSKYKAIISKDGSLNFVEIIKYKGNTPYKKSSNYRLCK